MKACRTICEHVSWSNESFFSPEFTSTFVFFFFFSLYIKKHFQLVLHRYIKYFSLFEVIKENILAAYSRTSFVRSIRLQGLYSELVFPFYIVFLFLYLPMLNVKAVYFLPLSFNEETN
jgi:hypothetical protein